MTGRWPAADRAHGLATSDVLEHDLLASPLVLFAFVPETARRELEEIAPDED